MLIKKETKEYERMWWSKIHISNNFLLSICLLIMFITLQYFATLNHTTPNYTSLHLSTLHFLSFTLHYSPIYISYRSISSHITKLDTVRFSHTQTYFQNNKPLHCPKELLTLSSSHQQWRQPSNLHILGKSHTCSSLWRRRGWWNQTHELLAVEMCAEVLYYALCVREILLKMACGKHTAWRVNTPNCVRDQWRANTTVTQKYPAAITQMWKLRFILNLGIGKSRESSGGLHDTAEYTPYVGKWSLVGSMTCPKFVLSIQFRTRIANRSLVIAASCRLRYKKCNIKQSHYRPGQAQRFPGDWGFQISRQSAHEDVKVVSPIHRPPLPLRKYCWYSLLLEAESTPRP